MVSTPTLSPGTEQRVLIELWTQEKVHGRWRTLWSWCALQKRDDLMEQGTREGAGRSRKESKNDCDRLRGTRIHSGADNRLNSGFLSRESKGQGETHPVGPSDPISGN